MKYFLLRKIYGLLWRVADSASGSDIQYGFYRRFKKPNLILNEELAAEIKRLGCAIGEASEMKYE